MRYLMAIGLILYLAACSAFVPARPASPTTGAGPAATAPQPSSAAHGTPSPAAPTATSAPAIPNASGNFFESALRPEFRGDLSLVHSPTLYTMNLRLNAALSQLSGTEAVVYTNREITPLQEIYFRLFANYPGSSGNISVDNVQVNGAAVTPVLESQDTALRVPLAQPLSPGQRLNLSLRFEVTVPVSNTTHYADFTNADGIVTLPTIYPLIPAYDAQGWHIEVPPPYGDLVYADTSFYDVRITSPVTTTVIASGTAVETTTQGAEKTWHYIGAPMRDFDIDVSSRLVKSSAQVGDITVNSYYLPEDKASGEDALQWASDALGIYQTRFGPYPFGELDVVETPTTAGGIEYPGLVVIASNLYHDPEQRQFFEFAVVHEVAHQWWYSQVGDDQVNTPWMDEALAQYSSLIYEQDKHGSNAAEFILKNVFQTPYDHAKEQHEDMPVGLPVSSFTLEQYAAIVYDKGPLFFHAVRQQIGDDNFFKFLRTYYQRFKYQIATPDDLRQTMDQAGGQNIDALYNQWILGK